MIHELIEHKTMGIQKIGGFHGKNSTQALFLEAFRITVYFRSAVMWTDARNITRLTEALTALSPRGWQRLGQPRDRVVCRLSRGRHVTSAILSEKSRGTVR
jgi:hypothetical protein